ncbi:hypothetical protein AGR3A_Lc10004 [Agrobacterium tomkonis CFBP 6623]|uniref:Uncharacterized protein n=1 Tax=Agrobacterium tomkonis CFBP 6623 TaxID=1183432 RepID=A0A1S7QTF8_9HYPH|nr:hypothetical protein AGR3A_Lc10004 [Agrobacterium tomkonis CFBP 6623]
MRKVGSLYELFLHENLASVEFE